MSHVGYAVMALLLYGLVNTVIDTQLKNKVDTLLMVIMMTSGVLVVSLVSYLALFLQGQAPTLTQDWKKIVLTLFLGAVLFFADYAYVSAYQKGGSAFQVTSVFIMLPVTMAVASFFFTKTWPTGREVLAFGLAAAAVFLLRTK